jgi:hypothetical protein
MSCGADYDCDVAFIGERTTARMLLLGQDLSKDSAQFDSAPPFYQTAVERGKDTQKY